MTGSLIFDFFYKGVGYETIEIFNEKIWDNYLTKALIMYGTAFVIMFPTCMIENIGKMRFAALLSILALIYLILVYNIKL